MHVDCIQMQGGSRWNASVNKQIETDDPKVQSAWKKITVGR